jgi:Raf kinase inhibitor-like YbhB/YbcL family protein
MKITSPAFEEKGQIPSLYTCEGEEINPPLHFTDVPLDAKSLVLIMDDPDVPRYLRADGMWDHWILFNLSPTLRQIKENTTPVCKSGMTTSGHTRYVGPCPPDREHRYFFKLYALDTILNVPSGCSKSELEKAMQGHILEQCQLIGLYQKKG